MPQHTLWCIGKLVQLATWSKGLLPKSKEEASWPDCAEPGASPSDKPAVCFGRFMVDLPKALLGTVSITGHPRP